MDEKPRILAVPGGTSVGGIAMAYASLHKLFEIYEDQEKQNAPAIPPTVVVLRSPSSMRKNTLRGSLASTTEAFPELPANLLNDPNLFNGVDLVIPTSGSSTGSPHLVGLSIEALLASANATHEALEGPGRWIAALPCHHIAGAQVLFRSIVADLNPQIVDGSHGFTPQALLPAIAGATRDASYPSYISLVPTQLRACLEDNEVARALASLTTVLLGGAAISDDILNRADTHGIHVVTTYGMTETAGGCVYDGHPLPGVEICTSAPDAFSSTSEQNRNLHAAEGRLLIRGPMLMTRYLDAPSPFVNADNHTVTNTRAPSTGRKRDNPWLLTGDIARINNDGVLTIYGRADDVIISGGLSLSPIPIEQALLECPEVEDAIVVPVEDPIWGQIVCGVIVPAGTTGVLDNNGQVNADALTLTAQAIRDFVGKKLGRSHAPRAILPVCNLPCLESGKVDRVRIRAIAANGQNLWRYM